jgi:hypothetical protein
MLFVNKDRLIPVKVTYNYRFHDIKILYSSVMAIGGSQHILQGVVLSLVEHPVIFKKMSHIDANLHSHHQ